jgi:hypothetical protein
LTRCKPVSFSNKDSAPLTKHCARCWRVNTGPAPHHFAGLCRNTEHACSSVGMKSFVFTALQATSAEVTHAQNSKEGFIAWGDKCDGQTGSQNLAACVFHRPPLWNEANPDHHIKHTHSHTHSRTHQTEIKNWIHPEKFVNIMEGLEERKHFINAFTDGSKMTSG